MKIIYYLIIAMAMTISAMAQVSVGIQDGNGLSYSKMKVEDFAVFKKSTLIFVYGNEAQEDERKQLELALKGIWACTPYKVLSKDDAAGYKEKDNYFFFTLVHDKFFKDLQESNYYINDVNFVFCAKIKKKYKIIGTMYLGSQIEEESNLPINFKPGFLRGYFAYANSYFKDNKVTESGGMKNSAASDELLKELKTDTLYLSDYFLPQAGKTNGKASDKTPAEKIMAGYEFPYRFMKSQDLSDLIVKSEGGLNYLIYNGKPEQNGYEIQIYNSKKGEFVYSAWYKNTITALDFKDLAHRINTRK